MGTEMEAKSCQKPVESGQFRATLEGDSLPVGIATKEEEEEEEEEDISVEVKGKEA